MLMQEQLRNKAGFTDVECKIADYFLGKGRALKNESARHIAGAVYASPSSIVRLCQKLGFEGYNDFREGWLQEQSYLDGHFHQMDANRPFEADDTVDVIARKLGALYQETIADTLALLDSAALVQAVARCRRASTIYLCASGAQVEMAAGFAEKMLKIGKTVVAHPRTDLMYFAACNCSTQDCFILISYSGETGNLLRVAQKLKERRVPAIALTSYGSNTLSGLFDCVLHMSTRERLVNNVGSFAAHMVPQFLLDVLYAGVFAHNFEENLAHKCDTSHEFELYRRSSNPLLQDK